MKTNKKPRLALVGTDSLRGNEIKNVLEQKKFPLKDIEFFDPDVAEEYSKLTQFLGEPKVIHHLDKDSLQGMDLVFLAADKKTNREYGLLARDQNFLAIDLSETFNGEEDIPLVVAGVNDGVLTQKKWALIANPHPVAVILSHILNLVFQKYGVLKAIAFVLQPVSAFDESGIEELADQSVALLSGTSLSKKVFKEQIAFNLLSHTEKPGSHGFSSAEKQVVSEIKRVLRRPNFPLSLSVIQAPVFHTYSIMIYLELGNATDIPGLGSLFKESPLIELCASSASCPVSSVSVAGKEKIFIGQVKKEEAFPHSFWFWLVADNLTRGSSLNAFEIARILVTLS
jgi:aspartate-semialdehyde dehydrogenase